MVLPVGESIAPGADFAHEPQCLLHLSKVPAAILYAATKLIYGPLNRSAGGASIASYLFKRYLNAIAPFGWREQHTIVFDHLVAPTAFYISREEFAQWVREIGAKEVDISWHNSNSWRGFGRFDLNAATCLRFLKRWTSQRTPNFVDGSSGKPL